MIVVLAISLLVALFAGIAIGVLVWPQLVKPDEEYPSEFGDGEH